MSKTQSGEAEYSTLFASAVDRFGADNVEDRTSNEYDMGHTRVGRNVGKFEVDVSDLDEGHVRDELEEAGFDVYLKPDGRFKEGHNPSAYIVVWAEGAEPLKGQEEVREELSECSAGDVLRLTTDDGESYKVHIVDSVDYVPADGYGAGHLSTSLELDTEEHAVPEEFDTCSVHLHASQSTRSWQDVTIAVWEPEVDETGLITEDHYRSLGTVVKVEVVERHE